EKLTGAGVYYGGSQAEAMQYKGEDVYIVGGANSAGQAAMYFSRYCHNVTMLVRGDSLSKSMSSYLTDQIEATDNIHVLANSSITEFHGEERLDAITIHNSASGEDVKVPAIAV